MYHLEVCQVQAVARKDSATKNCRSAQGLAWFISYEGWLEPFVKDNEGIDMRLVKVSSD